MLGTMIVAGLIGAIGYTAHKTKMSNSYTVAKILESAIDSGEGINVKGYFNLNEVAKVMAEDGYNLYDYIRG